MPPTAPKAPAEPDWDLLREKKPSLSSEHMGELAALSAKYLPPDAADFSGEDAISSLRALWEISKRENGGMKKGHAKKIIAMVASIQSAVLVRDTASRLVKKNNEAPIQQSFHSKSSSLLAPEEPKKLGMFGKARASLAAAKLARFVKSARKEIDKCKDDLKKSHKPGAVYHRDSAEDKALDIAIEAYNGKCDAALALYNEIPSGSSAKIKGKQALVDFIFTGFDANTNYQSFEYDIENAMKYVRILDAHRDELEELNKPELREKNGGGILILGALANKVQEHVLSGIVSQMDLISRERGNVGSLVAAHFAFDIGRNYPYLGECANMARIGGDKPPAGPPDRDLRPRALEAIRKNLKYMFSGNDASQGPFTWAEMMKKSMPDFYQSENIEGHLWDVLEREIKNGALYASYTGNRMFIDYTLEQIGKECPQFSDRAKRLADDILNNPSGHDATQETLKDALKTLEFGDGADFDALSLGEIHKQYLKLAVKYHPEKNIGADEEKQRALTEKMQALNQAWELLEAAKKQGKS